MNKTGYPFAKRDIESGLSGIRYGFTLREFPESFSKP